MAAIAGALRPYEFWLSQYRRMWRATVLTSVVNPIFTVAAIGLGVGHLVDQHGHGPGGVPYLVFVAPGLLVVAATQVAAGEGTWAVIGAIRWHRTYYAMIATPLRVIDVLLGHQIWIATRVLVASAAYLAVIVSFGGVRSPLALLAPPVAVVAGVGAAAPLAAFAMHTATPRSFNTIFAFLIGPMVFLSGTFFPIEALPAPIQALAYATPLWHGVELCRQLTLGTVRPALAAVNVAALCGWTALTLPAAWVTYRRRLNA